jgi:hypothetical protein
MSVLPPSSTPLRLGVLFVHGIGEQKRGETLVTWLDALLDTIGAATLDRVSTNIELADLKSPAHATDDGPAHAVVRIKGEKGEERWLVAEAWWAETFAAPTFRQLVSWSVRAVPWSLTMHAVQHHQDRLREARGWFQRALAWAYSVAGLAMSLFLAPFVVLFLAGLVLVGVVPSDTIRKMVGNIQRGLSATVGDSMVLLESSVRAAAIRTEVLRALYWLRASCETNGCGQIVVLAHSQGAAIMLDALIATSLPTPAEVVQDGSTPQVSTLVTFGAGINKLATLRSLQERRTDLASASARREASFLEQDPTWAASLLLFGAATVGAWFWHLLTTAQLSWRQLLGVPMIWAIGSLLVGGFGTAALQLARSFGETRPWLTKTLAGSGMAVFLGFTGVALWYAETTGTRLAPFFALFFILVFLIASFRSALSGAFNQRLMAAVPIPTGIGLWEDYWASADPVPNGPIRTRNDKVPISHEIWNEGSTLGDHVGYWRNRAGFVLPIVRTLASAASSSWQALLPLRSNDRDVRSRWRTGWLRAARWLTPAAWMLVGLLKGAELEGVRSTLVRAVKATVGLPPWLEGSSPLWRDLFRWGVVLMVGWVAYVLVRAVWRAWARWEHDATLKHDRPSGLPFYFYALGVAQSLVICAAFVVATTDWSAAYRSLSSGAWKFEDVGMTLWVVLVWCVVAVWGAGRIFSPPGRHAATAGLD